MEKINLIEQLFKEGRITFEQALILYGKDIDNIESLSDGNLQLKPSLYGKTDDETTTSLATTNVINRIAKKFTEPLIEAVDGIPMNVHLDVIKVVNVMNELDWTWQNNKEVTEKDFTERLQKLTADVIRQLYNKYKASDGNYNYDSSDNNFTASTGGIRVSGIINDRNNIELTAEFILDEATDFYNIKDLEKKIKQEKQNLHENFKTK